MGLAPSNGRLSEKSERMRRFCTLRKMNVVCSDVWRVLARAI